MSRMTGQRPSSCPSEDHWTFDLLAERHSDVTVAYLASRHTSDVLMQYLPLPIRKRVIRAYHSIIASIIALLVLLSMTCPLDSLADNRSSSCLFSKLSEKLGDYAPVAKDIGLTVASAAVGTVRGPLRIISGAIPKMPLYKLGDISVRNALFSPYTIEQAASVAETMQACDKFAVSMGFRRPGPTDIVMGNASSFHGIPKLDVISGTYKDLIYLDGTSNLPIDSLASVGHERFHNILIGHYGLGAYTSQEQAVQEALADIGAALFARSPHGFRNLIAQDVGYIHLIKSFSQYDGHRASLIFSMLFWRFKNIMGDQEAKKLYKVLVDDLNSSRGSFLSTTKETYDPDSVLPEVRYFFALVLKNTKGSPKEKSIRDEIGASLAKYKITLNELQQLSEKLVSDPRETLKYRHDRNVEAILIDVIGAGTIGVGGNWLIHHYVNDRE